MLEKKERALLAGADCGTDEESFLRSMEELGSLAEACFMEPAGMVVQKIEHLNKALYMGTGKIGEITAWLNQKIHWYGSTRKPKEAIMAVCGREVSAEPLVRYFKQKYSEIYKL